jgi:hypothetical protein
MPIVEALCLHDAWDSGACFYYEKGRSYPIDTDSEIAHLTVRPLSSGKLDKDGNIVAAKLTRQPMPVFQFDRAAPLGATGNGKPSDYTCDDCGRKFGSLNALGTHVRKEHPEEVFKDGTEDDEVEIVRISTCKQCDPPVQFTSRAEMMKHKGEVHGAQFFKKGFGKTEVEAEVIPA